MFKEMCISLLYHYIIPSIWTAYLHILYAFKSYFDRFQSDMWQTCSSFSTFSTLYWSCNFSPPISFLTIQPFNIRAFGSLVLSLEKSHTE